MSDLFRTRAPKNQLFKTHEGAAKRAAFENAHPTGNRPWRYSVRRCTIHGIVDGQGEYFKLIAMRDVVSHK